jgi:hypothetical protein
MNAPVIAEIPQADEEQAGGMGAAHHLLADPEFRLDSSDPAHGRLSMAARGASARCQATPKTAPLTTLKIAPLGYSGYSGFRKRVLA